MRHPSILQSDHTLLLIVDFQERMIPAMHDADSVTTNVMKLVKGICTLHIPVIVSEQYPKGLGHTASAVSALIQDIKVMEKIHFSCCGSREIWEALDEQKRKQIIAVGVEAHVCVLQTVLDLLHANYQVHVPFDCVASRNPLNRDNALERMKQAGATVTNLESVLFELMIKAGSDEFKQIQKLII
jgi:nicotinamidase-related amidase